MTKRTPSGKFARGTSGNPRGRPVGRGLTQQMREALRQATPAVLKAMLTRAVEGDTRAAAVILARSLPELRPSDEPIPADLIGEGTPAQRGRAVADALARGELTPTQATAAMDALATLGKLIESSELEARIAALEAAAKRLQS